jgi:hypothetical protein
MLGYEPHVPMARAALLCLLVTGCAHQARIETDPPGAEVYVNGERAGTTPADIDDDAGWRREDELTLRKDGYEPTQVTLTQGSLRPLMVFGALGCGLCTCGLAAFYFVPRIWRLDDEYRFVLVRKEAPPVPPPPPPGPPAVTPLLPASEPPAPGETPPGFIRYGTPVENP